MPLFSATPAYAVFTFCQLPWRPLITLVSLGKKGNDYRGAKNALEKYTLPYPVFASTNFAKFTWYAVQSLQVNWLIEQFNGWFSPLDTILVKGDHEPEYLAKTVDSPAKIVFAHGFFASGLHEISHWCVAGKRRRGLDDFGYWYAPDGRNADEQRAFEQVEIMPQAIECLLTLMCGKRFEVSQDNLCADFDTSHSTFAHDVANRTLQLWQTGEKLPSDAKFLLSQLQPLRPLPLTVFDIKKNFLSN